MSRSTGKQKLSRKYPLISKLVKYVFAGGMAAVTEWLIYGFCVYYPHLHYFPSACVAFMVATAVNYVLSVHYVFQPGRHSRRREILMVYMISLVSLVLNLGVLTMLIELASMNAMVAKILATGFVFMWNFMARYLWVFNR
jgi:putative flippase GtrA